MPDSPNALLPPLAAIRAFEAAARHRNFTAAGAELGLTQAAVSYQIRVLEDRVGVPLFRRRARGVSLTVEGARLADRATEALDVLRDAFAEARQEARETLVISVLATFAEAVLAPRLGQFQIAHPEITTRVEVDQRIVDLQTGDATVAIRCGKGVWPGLVAHFLIRPSYSAMISAAFIARHGRPRTPADLRDMPLIDPDDEGWDGWFAAQGVTYNRDGCRGASHLGTQVLTVKAALAGQGACLLSPTYFGDLLARGDLEQPFAARWHDPFGMYLVYPERKRNSPAVRAFRDWLLAEMRGYASPEWGEDVPPDAG